MTTKPTPSSRLLQGLLICLLVFSGCRSKTNTHILAAAATLASISTAEAAGDSHLVAAPDGLSALSLIRNYNARPMGTPAVRRVVLELLNDGIAIRSFTVMNLWSNNEQQTLMLFLLEAPQGLRGTDYLLVEDKHSLQETRMKIHIYLPSGRQLPMEVKPNNFDEGLLGSDFSYNDLCMLLPVAGYDYRLVEQTTLLDEPAWVIEARPTSPTKAHKWTLARFYLAKRFQLLLGADYFAATSVESQPPSLLKAMRLQSFARIDGIWTATRIMMSTANNRASVLSLKNIAYGIKLKDSTIFSPENLPGLAAKFRPEWFHEDSRAVD